MQEQKNHSSVLFAIRAAKRMAIWNSLRVIPVLSYRKVLFSSSLYWQLFSGLHLHFKEMSLLENDDLPTINPFHVHVREPCFLGCDPNFKLQVCNEVLWTLRKRSAKEIATCFFNCLWELGFRLTDDSAKRVLKIIVPKVTKFQKTYSGVQGKRARQEKRSQWFTILVTPKNSVVSPGMNYVHYDKKVSA